MTTAMVLIATAAVAVAIMGITELFYSDDLINLPIIGETLTAPTTATSNVASLVLGPQDVPRSNNNNNNIISDDELDCQMRQLFYDMSKKAVPWRKDMSDVYNSLELDGCAKSVKRMDTVNVELASVEIKNETSRRFQPHLYTPDTQRSTQTERFQNRRRKMHGGSRHNVTNNVVFYVCPDTGRDEDASNHVGNKTHPFATLERALEATRHHRRTFRRQQHNTMLTIVMKPGIHFIKDTIVLRPEDSNLRLISERRHHGRHHGNDDNNDDKHRPWISGGILIASKTTPWKKLKSTDNRHFTLKSNNTVWVADLTSMGKKTPSNITGLFTVGSRLRSGGTSGIQKRHERMTLARYPNADVEEWNSPDRYMGHDTVHEWVFPPFSDVPHFEYIDLSLPNNPTGHTKNDSTMEDYNSFGTGQGGACATVWGDLPSYWCGNVSAGGWAEIDRAAAVAGRMNIPRGMVLQSKSSNISSSERGYNSEEAIDQFIKRVQRWSNPQGGIVHVSHTQGWAWHMFEIHSVESNRHNATIHFEPGGGSQGGRNWQCKDRDGHLSNCNDDDKKLAGGDWYVEGIFEELDAKGEFYYDNDQKRLYFIPKDDCCNSQNDDDPSTCIPDLVATNLQTLIKIEGSMADPVKNIEIRGLGFRDARKTYLEQWQAQSGGDWSLHRGGAIHMEGSEHVTILDSYFHRLDGNAVFLGGYSHKTKIARCDFAWIGNGAIATWGDTVNNGYDATLPTQPRHSLAENNIFSNLGLYQKQSSAWGQSKSCLNVVRNNVMFDLPRAAINFNDGLGGGNVIERNILFNTCRESGDHGPINSWDRMPFLTNVDDRGPTFTPLPTMTTQNLIFANYGASEGFDNDDGSSFYHTFNNVFYSSDGFKMDYGGHDSMFAHNLVVSSSNKHCFGTGSFNKGHADVFDGNICIVDGTEPHIGTLWQCDAQNGMNPTQNKYYTRTGNATWGCKPDSESLTLDQMQAKGFEIGSTVGPYPNVETIMEWAKEILNMNTLAIHHKNQSFFDPEEGIYRR